MKSKSDHALIFDLDGTLWDTVSLCARAWNHAVALRGLTYRKITDDDVRGGMGLAADDLRARVFPDLNRAQGTALLQACFEQEIVELDRAGATFFPGVLEGIPRLAELYDLYIVSNCDSAYLQAFLRVSKLARHFRDAECHGATGLTKGQNIQLILNRNSLRTATYIGDTQGDQNASEHAGLPFVFVRYGFGKCERFDHAFDSFAELETHFGRPV